MGVIFSPKISEVSNKNSRSEDFGDCVTEGCESWMSEVAKALKLTLFYVKSLKTLTSAFSQIFTMTPNFFQDFDDKY